MNDSKEKISAYVDEVRDSLDLIADCKKMIKRKVDTFVKNNDPECLQTIYNFTELLNENAADLRDIVNSLIVEVEKHALIYNVVSLVDGEEVVVSQHYCESAACEYIDNNFTFDQMTEKQIRIKCEERGHVG